MAPIRLQPPSGVFKQFGISKGYNYASQALKLCAILASLEATIMHVCVRNCAFSCWLLHSQVLAIIFATYFCYEKHIGNSFHVKEKIFPP